jgi:hypothetical protein
MWVRVEMDNVVIEEGDGGGLSSDSSHYLYGWSTYKRIFLYPPGFVYGADKSVPLQLPYVGVLWLQKD